MEQDNSNTSQRKNRTGHRSRRGRRVPRRQGMPKIYDALGDHLQATRFFSDAKLVLETQQHLGENQGTSSCHVFHGGPGTGHG